MAGSSAFRHHGGGRRGRYCWVSLVLVILLSSRVSSQAPGLVYTEEGYDNIDGKEAICWVAPAFHNHALVTEVLSWFNLTHTHDNETDSSFYNGENDNDDDTFQGRNWNSALQPTFRAGPTSMSSSCPDGMSIQMELLPENLHGSDLYRTHHFYTYHVKASMDLNVLREAYNLTDTAFIESADGNHSVAIRIIFCPVNGNFCSPFVVERIKNTLTLGSTIYNEHDRHRNLVITARRIMQQNGQQQLKELASNIFIVPVANLNETAIDFDVDINIEVEEAGNYLPLASMQFFLGNDTIHGHEPGIDESVAFKFDIANLLPQRSVHYYDPLYIDSVSKRIEYLSYAIVGIAGLAQLILLGFTIRYRKEAVMTLSQGGFLIALQVAALMATVCSVLYNPVSDVTCKLQGPLTLIPLQFVVATVFGRLLRILSIMAPLLDWHSNSGKNSHDMVHYLRTWKQTFMFSKSENSRQSHNSESSAVASMEERSQTTNDSNRRDSISMRMKSFGRKRTNIRRQFSRRRLCVIVLLVTLPMVIVEVVGLAVFSPERMISVNDDESAGRFECGDDDYQIYQLSSTAVIVVTVFLDLYQAQKSRKLPALFNEVESVTSALMTTLFVSLIGFAVILITADPETSPGIPYLMQVIIIVNAAVNMAVRLVLPKLRLIWKGEKVVISRVLADHRRSQGTTPGTSSGTSTFQSMNSTYMPASSAVSSCRVSEVSRSDAYDSSTATIEAEDGQAELGKAVAGPVNWPSEADSEDLEEESTTAAAVGKSVTFSTEDPEDESNGKPRKRISFSLPDVPEETEPSTENPSVPKAKQKKVKPTVIVDGQSPPSKLVSEFLNHSNRMSRVGERILSGLQVSRDDWEDIRTSLNDLNRVLEHVEYKEE